MKIEINHESISLTASRASLLVHDSNKDKEVLICMLASSNKAHLQQFEDKIKHMVSQIYFSEQPSMAIYFKKPNYSKDEINKLSIEFIESILHEKPETQNRQAAYC